MRFLYYDIKRMFQSKRTLALCILAPIVVMIIFSTVITPLIFKFYETNKFTIAIYNEDGTEFSKEFINYMVNSKSLKDLVEPFSVPSKEMGKKLLKSGKVLVFVHVPRDTYNNITQSKPTKIHVHGMDAHVFEASLISITLESALDWVGKGENVLGVSTDFILDKGASAEEANAFYGRMVDLGLDYAMDRRAILAKEGTVTPIDEYLPIQYYLSAIFALFAGIAILPLVRFTSNDLNSSVLQRSFVGQRGIAYFIGARILSGALFITLILTMVFPAGIITSAINDIFSANYPSLVIGIFTTAISLSSLALLLASLIKRKESAMWVAFWIIILLAAIGGCFVPYNYLPKLARDIGMFSPLRGSKRIILCGLFAFNKKVLVQELTMLISLTIAFTSLSYILIKRKRWDV